jgi:hypothetical protein
MAFGVIISRRESMPQEDRNFMATNASTWFYTTPEYDRYLIEERVNHTFWNNRITGLTLYCTHAEPPFRMEGEWRGRPVTIEWVPKETFTLITENSGDEPEALIIGIKEILGLLPSISYVDSSGTLTAEWHVMGGDERARQIESNASYTHIKRYKK